MNTAMIFAAGLGTRLKPFTDHHPKALAVVNKKTLLERNIEYLKSFGISNIVVNTHHFADQIFDFLAIHNNFGITINVSHEIKEPLETGGGLLYAAPLLKESNPFLVMNADILTNLNIAKMLAFHQQQNNSITLAVSGRYSSRAFLFDGEKRLIGWENLNTKEQKITVPTPQFHSRAFSGVHIIDPAVFDLITETGKFSLVDLYLRLAPQIKISVFDHSGDVLIDVGKPEAIAKAEAIFA